MGPYGYAKECFETETRSLTFLGLKGFLFFFELQRTNDTQSLLLQGDHSIYKHHCTWQM